MNLTGDIVDQAGSIARRGWNAWNVLNRVLLEHPDVIKMKIMILIDDDDNDIDDDSPAAHPGGIPTTINILPSQTMTEGDNSTIMLDLTTPSIAKVATLNLMTGIAGTLLADLLQDVLKNEHVKNNLES